MISFRDRAWADYLYWQKTDKSKFKRINQLVRDIQRDPFVGIGKPEPLRHDLAGLWSRRIDGGHRLVYAVDGENIIIMQCRYHYGN
uniref:Putative mRNA interferase YoeB n=1 Tax=Candidatus Kentrum sp. UNK TaxID=2126344 RepID=A0A451AD76_9GAMM|nr:MAG: toxin YoeB [Candidatus Kentron sp. UNK]VFK70996.1 MAG: toxin YoeB [Candidatus Kentron sp. UNK]